MKIKNKIKKVLFILIYLNLSYLFMHKILNPVFTSNNIIITYSLEPFNIVSKFPIVWKYIKNIYVATFIILFIQNFSLKIKIKKSKKKNTR